MNLNEPIFGHQKVCRRCLVRFSLCQTCYDCGGLYCSHPCAKAARLQRRRAASAKYRSTEAGKKNHNAAQVKYRKKKKRNSEIYHSSENTLASIQEPGEDASENVGSVIAPVANEICSGLDQNFIESGNSPEKNIHEAKLDDEKKSRKTVDFVSRNDSRSTENYIKDLECRRCGRSIDFLVDENRPQKNKTKLGRWKRFKT